MKRVISIVLQPMVILAVKIIPLRALNNIIKFLPSTSVAKFVSHFTLTKNYKISLFETEFLLESGPRDDHYLELEKNNLKNWENDVLSTWAREVVNADLVVDVGAYLGIYSILAAKLGCKRIIAVEPNSHNFIQLQKNLSLNQIDNLVKGYQVALGAHTRRVSVITPGKRPNSSGSQIADSPTGRDLISWEIESEVNMVTLDTLLLDESSKVSVIKIDAEGYELLILQGSVKTLQSQSPCLLIELLDEGKKLQADKFLLKFGYPAGSPIDKSPHSTNFLYKK